ncbi:hypothetical protein DM860_000580 [Cuscuta australis]|uniref:Uncharacterized protein n=1 Tax=Cuscuta australis TaxID=267555 RepID=A0A328CXL3_9ASTE|nr:hypothetical protein DM860_000580 [Cuscuta australis]
MELGTPAPNAREALSERLRVLRKKLISSEEMEKSISGSKPSVESAICELEEIIAEIEQFKIEQQVNAEDWQEIILKWKITNNDQAHHAILHGRVIFTLGHEIAEEDFSFIPYKDEQEIKNIFQELQKINNKHIAQPRFLVSSDQSMLVVNSHLVHIDAWLDRKMKQFMAENFENVFSFNFKRHMKKWWTFLREDFKIIFRGVIKGIAGISRKSLVDKILIEVHEGEICAVKLLPCFNIENIGERDSIVIQDLRAHMMKLIKGGSGMIT